MKLLDPVVLNAKFAKQVSRIFLRIYSCYANMRELTFRAVISRTLWNRLPPPQRKYIYQEVGI